MPHKKSESTNDIRDIYFSEDGKRDFYQEVTTNLFEGMELSNFESLCRILNIENIPFGAARTRYKKLFSCFFKYHRLDPSFHLRIDEIYNFNNIKEYESPTSNGKTKSSDHTPRFSYQKYMLPILQDYVTKNTDPYYLTYTSMEIYPVFGFTNTSIQKLSDKVQKISIDHNYSSMMKYPVIFTALKSIISSNIMLNLLKSLKKEGIINEYGKLTYIKYSNTDIQAATQEQLIEIEHIRNTIIEKINSGEYKKPCDYTLTERMITRLTNIELKKEHQYETCGMRYYIKFNKDKFTPRILSDVEKTELQLTLNQKLKERLKTSLTTTSNNIIKKVIDVEKEIPALTDKSLIQTKQNYIKTLTTRYNIIGRNPNTLLDSFLKVSDQYTDIGLESTEDIIFSTYEYSEYDDFLPNYTEY